MFDPLNLFRSKDYLSIDFSGSALKIARAEVGETSLKVDLADREAIQGLREENMVAKYTGALRSIMDRNDLSGDRRVLLSIPTNEVIVRYLALPAMSEDRLSDVIQYEAESHIPFTLEEVAMDYHVVETTEEETRLILVASQKESLRRYIEVVNNVNFKPDIIDVSSFSLFNLYHHLKDGSTSKKDDSPKVLVNINHQWTDFIIFQESTVYTARSASIAGQSLVREICDRLGVGPQRAEQLLGVSGDFTTVVEEGIGPDPPQASTSKPEAGREMDQETTGDESPDGESVDEVDEVPRSNGNETQDTSPEDVSSPDQHDEGEPSPESHGEELPEPSQEPDLELDTEDQGPLDSPSDDAESDTSEDDGEGSEGLDLKLGQLRSPGEEGGTQETQGPEETQAETSPLESRETSDEVETGDTGTVPLGAAADEVPWSPEEFDLDTKLLQEAIVLQLDRLIREMRQTFDYFENVLDGDPVEEIILCGPVSGIYNLPDYIENNFAVDTTRFDPGNNITGLSGEDLWSMMVPSGLQLRKKAPETGICINLLPEEIIRRRKARNRRRKIVTNGVLAGLLFLQILGWAFYSYRLRQSYFRTSKEQLETVQPIVNRVNNLKETRQRIRNRVEMIKDLHQNRTRLLPVIQQLNQLGEPLRGRTWFNKISYSDGQPHGTLTIQGVSGSFQDVSRLYQWLDQFEFTLEQRSENQSIKIVNVNGESRNMVQFTVEYTVTFVPVKSQPRDGSERTDVS